ncbi:sialidase family protein [Pseudomonas sp. DE0157]|uniref:sialidase family protein n=1 Tax=Pseudomonas sp. DE0157 TaxID=2584952 RepID=UPI0011A1408F|nr:sialidase family protein [Pseudomonas sp. DE0157]
MLDYLPVIQVFKEITDSANLIAAGENVARMERTSTSWVLTKSTPIIAESSRFFRWPANNKMLSQSVGMVSDVEAGEYSAKSNSYAPNELVWNASAKGEVSPASVVFNRPPKHPYVDSAARIERNLHDPFYSLPNRKYQATPTIARTGPSRYWAAWRADNVNPAEGPGNFAVLAYSDDGANSVNEYGYVTYSPSQPGNQIIDPMLWTDPQGRLWLFYGVSGDNKLYDGVGGAWAIICDDPNSDSPKWSEPFRLSYYGDPRRPVAIGDRWYITLDGWRFSAAYPPFYDEHVGPHVYELDWNAKKIKHISQLPPNNNGQYSGFFETELVERSDGSVLALLRSTSEKSNMQYSVSRDRMKSWTPWEDYKVTVPSSSSRAWLGRTPSGLLLLCWNNDHMRGSLTIGISEDDGNTYRYKKIIEPDSSIQASYPVVTFGDDGEILVIYDNGRDSQRQIRLSRFFEKDITSHNAGVSVKVLSDPLNMDK